MSVYLRPTAMAILAIFLMGLSGCSGSDSGTTPTPSTDNPLQSALSAASNAVDNAVPNIGGSTALNQQRTSWLYAALKWIGFSEAFAAAVDTVWNTPGTVEPPGGTVGAGEPTYDGAAIPAQVDIETWMKMSLDSNFFRKSSDGAENYRPTIFGRFDEMVQIIGYISDGFTADQFGVPVVGPIDSSITLPFGTVKVIGEAANATDDTIYDRVLNITGFDDANGNGNFDSGETLAFRNLMWIRNNAATTNFKMVEIVEDSGDELFNMGSLTWGKNTGSILFEYTSSSTENGSINSLKVFRLLSQQTDGNTLLYSFEGGAKEDAAGLFKQFALYSPEGGSATEASASVLIKHGANAGDVYDGNVCITLSTGDAASGQCAGHGGMAPNMTTMMTATSNIQKEDGVLDVAQLFGFPGNDFRDNDANAAAWIAAGEAAATSFSIDGTGFENNP